MSQGSKEDIFIIDGSESELIEPTAGESTWLADMGIDEEDGALGPIDEKTEIFYAEDRADRVFSPILNIHSISLADEFEQTSTDDDGNDDAIEPAIWRDIPLSPEQEGKLPSIVITAENNEAGGCNGHGIPEYSGEEEAHRFASNFSEANGPYWHPELAYSGLNPRSGYIRENNQRLSRYDKWQQQPQRHSMPALQDKSKLCVAGTVIKDIEDSGELEVIQKKMTGQGETLDDPQTIVNVQGHGGRNSHQAPEIMAKTAIVESDQQLPKRTNKPENTQDMHPHTSSHSEIVGGLDNSDVRTLGPFSASPSPHQISKIMGDDKLSCSPQSTSSGYSSLLDEGTLSQILENCIRQTSSLLSNGTNKQALARSQEIARLMGSLLTDEICTPNVVDEERSLSDMLDNSSLRPL